MAILNPFQEVLLKWNFNWILPQTLHYLYFHIVFIVFVFLWIVSSSSSGWSSYFLTDNDAAMRGLGECLFR